MNLRNGRALIFDLGSKESSEEELAEAHVLEEMSSIRLADALIAEHGESSLVVGAGPLTGSLLPAACSGIVRVGGQRPRTIPLLGFAGVELKMSGFDFVVLKGKADTPGYLWLRDGMAEFSESREMSSLSSWARTDRIRSDQGDSKIQVVTTGSWGDAGLGASQLIVNYWGGEDKAGMAAEFGVRGVSAFAFRGMGEMELADPERHFEEAVSLVREHMNCLGENRGLASYSDLAQRDDFDGLAHRHVACYGCPFPCRTFLKTSEDPGELRLVSREPGYLHYDIAALEKAFQLGADAKAASEIISLCAKRGAEPVAVMSMVGQSGKQCTAEGVGAILDARGEVPSAGASNMERAFGKAGQYETCLGLGLCPRYWSRVGFDPVGIARLARSPLGLSH